VYLAKDDFDRVCLPPDSRVFVVIRDLRDTLVSAYFSFKISHSIQFESQRRLRETLCSLDTEEGLWYLMENGMAYCAKIQLSWLEAGATILKYEDLLENDVALLEETLIGHCGLAVDPSTLREIVLRNRFDVLTAGRQRGTEDRSRHERRGVAGDWRNHFSDKLKKAFKARFGGVLVATGYEKDLNW
jgi:lipopolysaccharide transport system ATP-binding protein